jgi:hypothetical protein
MSSWAKNKSSWVDTTPYEFAPEMSKPLVGSRFKVTDATLGSLIMTLTRVELPQAKSGSTTAGAIRPFPALPCASGRSPASGCRRAHIN